MNRSGLLVFLMLAITISFSQENAENTRRLYLAEYKQYDAVYHKAEQLSQQANYTEQTEEQETALNLQALRGFKKIIPAIEKARNDSLAFHCYYKIGILEHYFDSLPAAQLAYTKAIELKSKLPSLPDSFLFKLYLFTGGIQYNNNQYDSALANYKKAEEIGDHYKSTLDGRNRLYNTLGAMYYETGNFRQAKNYFEKSVSLLNPKEPSYTGLLVNYKINLAATLTRLEEYNEANAIYESILPLRINTNDILHNIGTIYYKLGDSRKAISYFSRVSYSNTRIIRLLNDIGLAYASLKQHDSARHYYLEAVSQNQKWNGIKKNVQAGLTLKYWGDELINADKPEQAVEKYQQAIIQFAAEFNEPDVYKNPEQFSGVFSYINLFNALSAKADALHLLYYQQNDLKLPVASLDTYHAAFDLASYVERTYDSDEARLFLDKIKYSAHSKPIDISLQLYELTKNKKYLEEAWVFDQRNKASILTLNMQQNEGRYKKGPGNELLEREASLKSSITRFSLAIAQTTDSIRLQIIRAAIRDSEIELGKVQDKINSDPAYADKELTGEIPSVKEIQKKLDDKTALLSYHLSEKELLLLIITGNQFDYFKTTTGTGFFEKIDSLKISLHNTSAEKRYNGMAVSAALYKLLISPVQSKLSAIERLIIIPDDELNYLPFEVLQDEKGKYLVERFAIQYLYSAVLLDKKGKRKKAENILAFAPFTTAGYKDSAGNNFSSLPASKEEVSSLKGKILVDNKALKSDFLHSANHFGIIHLATHSSVNNEMPLRSYITFFPVSNNPADYKLYAQEIYDMKLDSAKLIILSACETGTGQLIKGEGLMSLSRAFAYAGCPNIITSLWKAEDKTTAFITQRLHHYLEKGLHNDKALQRAKLDLLRSDVIDPRYKTPVYWGHLLFIGNYETRRQFSNWWWIAIAIIAGSSVYLVYKRKAWLKNKSGPGLHKYAGIFY